MEMISWSSKGQCFNFTLGEFGKYMNRGVDKREFRSDLVFCFSYVLGGLQNLSV